MGRKQETVSMEQFLANADLRKYGKNLVDVFPKWYINTYHRKINRTEKEWMGIYLKFVNN